MTTDQTAVEQMTADYLQNGTAANFILPNAKRIKGYMFPKNELKLLLEPYEKNQFYLMLGLTDKIKGAAAGGKYITIIIGRILPNGKIDPNNLIYCDDPYTGVVTLDGNIYPAAFIDPANEPDRLHITGHGNIITPANAKNMIDEHLINLKPLTLDSPGGFGKLEAFNVYNSDLEFLFEGIEPNDFMIMPALKDKNKDGSSVVPPHLTLILTWIDQSQNLYTVKMLDYCLPCPAACHTF